MSNEPTTPKYDGSNVYLGLSPDERKLYKQLMFMGAFKSGKSTFIKSIAPYETNPCKEIPLNADKGMEFIPKSIFDWNRFRPRSRSITIHKDGPNNYVHIDPYIHDYDELNLSSYDHYKTILAKAMELKYNYDALYGEPGFFRDEYSNNGQRLGENKSCENQQLIDQYLDLEPRIDPGSMNFLIQSTAST